jgi:hypothetical protein
VQLLLALLLLPAQAPAQPSLPQLAGYQRRQRAAHIHRAAPSNSLRRAWAGQPADTLQQPPPQATDLARLQAARPRWPADSLGRLLVYVRLAHAFQALHRPDSAARYLGRAWRLAGARQGQQPAVVIQLAAALAGLHYDRSNYDSTLYYYQRAARQFRAAGRPLVVAWGPPQLLLAAPTRAGQMGRRCPVFWPMPARPAAPWAACPWPCATTSAPGASTSSRAT